MWRPSPTASREIILLRMEDNQAVKIPIIAELYPYSNPISRQAIGITNEEAYTVLYAGPKPLIDDVFLVGESIYPIRSAAPYEPVQLVIVDAGMTEAEYLEERGAANG